MLLDANYTPKVRAIQFTGDNIDEIEEAANWIGFTIVSHRGGYSVWPDATGAFETLHLNSWFIFEPRNNGGSMYWYYSKVVSDDYFQTNYTLSDIS